MTLASLSKSALLAVLIHSVSGCSFAMTKPPATIARPDEPVECTSATSSPVLDTICAVIFLSATVNLARARTCDGNPYDSTCLDEGSRNGAMAVTAGLGALCAVAAGTGFDKATRCGQVKATNLRCIKGDEAACSKLNSTWTPPMRLPAGPAGPGGAATPPGEGAAAPAGAGCSRDVDCKGDRVCERGACTEPTARAAPVAP